MKQSDTLARPAFSAIVGETAFRRISIAGAILCLGLLKTHLVGNALGTRNHTALLHVVRRLLDPSYLPGDFSI